MSVKRRFWTPRELDLFEQGLTDREISEKTDRSIHSVANKRASLRKSMAEEDIEITDVRRNLDIRVGENCVVTRKGANGHVLERRKGKLIGDYDNYVLFKCNKGLKEGFLKADVAFKEILLDYRS